MCSASKTCLGVPDGGSDGGLDDACGAVTSLTLTALADGGTGATFSADTSTGSARYVGTNCASYASSGRELVYRLRLTAAKDVYVTATPDAGVDSVVYLRNAPCSVGSELGSACVDDQGGGEAETLYAQNVQPGDYYLFIDSYAGSSSGAQEVTVGLAAPTVPPPGDSCASALPAPSTNGAAWRVDLASFTGPATGEAGTCGNGSGGRDVVYSVTTTAAQDITVKANSVPSADGGTGVTDAVIWVRASPCATGDQLVCTDSAGASGTETAWLKNRDAGTYYVFVKGYSAAMSGPVDISVLVGPPTIPPASDNCSNVTAAPKTDGGSWIVNLAAFEHEFDSSCGSSFGPDAIYSVNVPAAQSMTVTATPLTEPDGGSSDVFIVVTESPCETGTEVQCEDTTGTGLADTLTVSGLDAGTYYIVVGHFLGGSGPVDISVNVGP